MMAKCVIDDYKYDFGIPHKVVVRSFYTLIMGIMGIRGFAFFLSLNTHEHIWIYFEFSLIHTGAKVYIQAHIYAYISTDICLNVLS